MPLDHHDESHPTIVSLVEQSETRLMDEEVSQMLLRKLSAQCNWAGVLVSISRLSDPEVTSLNRSIARLLDQYLSWESSMQAAPPLEVPDTEEEP